MDNVRVYILNHKSRLEYRDRICEKIRSEGVEPLVFTDQSDYHKERGKTKYKGVYDNFRAIMAAGSTQEEEWALIFHDDVSIPAGVFSRVEHILRHVPARVGMLSFYNPHNGFYDSAQASKRHVVLTHINFWTQCFCFRKSAITPILEWGTKHIIPGWCAEDGYLWRYCSWSGERVAVIVPSLIQHEGHGESTFKIPARTGKYERKSANYSPDWDTSRIDWAAHFENAIIDRSKKLDTQYLQNIEELRKA